MLFRKNLFLHRRNSEINLIGNRFVFKDQPEVSVQKSVEKIDRDIEALEAKLDMEQDMKERNKLGKEIKELKAEKNRLQVLKILFSKDTETASAMYAGITNTLSWLDGQLGKESDLDKRKLLEARKKTCLDNLEEIRHPLKNETDLKYALNEWAIDNRRLDRLKSKELDYLDLSALLGSNLASFFDDDTIARIEIAEEQMKRADFAMRAIQPVIPSELIEKATEEWTKKRKGELDTAYVEARKNNDEDMAELINIERGAEAREDWIFKRALMLEKTKAFKMRDRVPEIVIEKAKAMVIEAREIRKNAIVDYLTEQLSQNRQKLLNVRKKKPPRISQDQVDKINGYLTLIQDQLRDHESLARQHQVVKQLAVNLGHTDKELMTIEKEIDEYGDSPEKFVETIRYQYERFKYVIDCFTPERINQLLEALDQDELRRIEETPKKERTEWDVFGKSAIYQKKRKALLGLKDPKSPLRKQKADFEKLFNRSNEEILKELSEESVDIKDEKTGKWKNKDKLTYEKLILVKNDLDEILNKVGLFKLGEKIDDALHPERVKVAGVARETIKKLEDVKDLEGIKKIITDPSSPFHNRFEFVNGDTFGHYEVQENDYRNLNDHTSGAMVFLKINEEEWKIIINEDKIETQNAKSQIIHELLHVEFENSPLKEKWIEVYTKSEKWSDIEKAWNDFAELRGKKPPKKGQTKWDPEDIVNELYAMQNDIGMVLEPKEQDEFDRLKNLVISAGIPQSVMGLVDKNGKPKDIVKAYGAEEGGENAESIMEMAPKEDTKKEEEGGEKLSLGSAEQYAKDIQGIDKTIKDYQNSEYISYIPGASGLLSIMKSWNDDTEKLNDEYAKTSSVFLSGKIKERIDQIKKDLEDIKAEIQKVSENIPNQVINPLRSLWNDTNFISLDDLIQVGVDIKEWWQRRHNRRKADHAARVGAALFDKMPLPIIGEFGTEAEARKQKAEADEVNEWKSRLETKDAWELINIIRKMAKDVDPNRDQLKAILRILADKGRIDWREKSIWILLNKLQNATHLSPNDELILSNPVLLRQKLHQACGEIWDYDEFLNLKRTNESNYESKKKEYMENTHEIQRSIDKRLDQLYKKHLTGGQVEPMEYEALLEYAIVNGKCYQEAVMFYLIAGVARGILTPDRPMVLDKYLNEFPTIEYVCEESAPKSQKQAEKMCETFFRDDYQKGEVGLKFKNFYWTTMQNSQQVLERIRKSAPERKWDHDWSRGIAAMCDGTHMKIFLSGRSGETVTKSTAMENMYVGILQWSEENAVDPTSRDWRSGFYRQITAFCMAEGIRTWVAFREDPKFQRGENILGNIARENDVSNHGDWVVGKHRDKMEGFVGTFTDGLKGFHDLITDTAGVSVADPDKKGKAETHLAKIKNHLSRYSGIAEMVNNFQSLDDVFNNIDAIIAGILDEVDNATFLKRIATLRTNM